MRLLTVSETYLTWPLAVAGRGRVAEAARHQLDGAEDFEEVDEVDDELVDPLRRVEDVVEVLDVAAEPWCATPS